MVIVIDNIMIIEVEFWGEESQTANGLATSQTRKNNLTFGWKFFANLQSVAISQ